MPSSSSPRPRPSSGIHGIGIRHEIPHSQPRRTCASPPSCICQRNDHLKRRAVGPRGAHHYRSTTTLLPQDAPSRQSPSALSSDAHERLTRTTNWQPQEKPRELRAPSSAGGVAPRDWLFGTDCNYYYTVTSHTRWVYSTSFTVAFSFIRSSRHLGSAMATLSLRR